MKGSVAENTFLMSIKVGNSFGELSETVTINVELDNNSTLKAIKLKLMNDP